MVKVTSLLIKPESALGFTFVVRASNRNEDTVRYRHVHMLKVVSSATNLGVNPLTTDDAIWHR